MKLRNILLAGALTLSSTLFSQELDYNIAGRADIPLIKRLKVKADLNLNPTEIDFTFYDNSMKFQKLNDSTYREIVNNTEFYEYSIKDSVYTLRNYYSLGKSRAEKEILMGRVFGKYKSLPDLVEKLVNKGIGDSLHFIVLGNPYSASFSSVKKGKHTTFTGNPSEFIKKEEGDKFHFKYPVKIEVEEKNGKNIPIEFSTKCLIVPLGLRISIEGKLKD